MDVYLLDILNGSFLSNKCTCPFLIKLSKSCESFSESQVRTANFWKVSDTIKTFQKLLIAFRIASLDFEFLESRKVHISIILKMNR